LRHVKVASTTLEEKAGRLRTDIENEKVAIQRTNEEWTAYKDEYREFVRTKATGEVLELLEARDGTIYKDVNIREVTAIGMQIRHANGFKRLEFEELSDELQDYYQYDPAQKDAALAAEQKARKRHDAAAGAAVSKQAEKMAEQKAEELAEKKAGIRREIIRKEAAIKDAEGDIRDLEAERVRADAAAAAARAAGRMHLSKGNSINGKIRSKKNQIIGLKDEIRRLQAQL
jgi:chromosome segregation ATPase